MQCQQNKLKILITTDLYTTKTNGVVTSVRNLFEELTAAGHDVRILTLSENLHSRREGPVYYIRSIPLKGVYPDLRMPTAYRNKLIQEIIEWKPDVVHSQCEFFSYQFASRIARITGAPIVHTYHTLYEQYITNYIVPNHRLGDFLVSELTRLRLRRASAVVAPTHKVEEALQGYGLRSPISVVPSGINLDQHHLRLSEQERLERRRSLGIADTDLVLLNLGRLGCEKNLEELLLFFAQAREKDRGLKFLIVGDGPARQELEALTKELKLEKDVIFTGMVDPSQVQFYYQLGDVFVSASTSETQGLTYIEAAANGLPLLCRQDNCLDQVLVEGSNGYEYTDSDEFLQAIDNLFHNPAWRASAARRSEEIAAAFDKKTFREAIENVYESVLV